MTRRRSLWRIERVAELFAGKMPQVPLIERGFKAAAREQRNDQPELDI